ncbi:hypothetical protein Hanom_Chr09g00822991 [Helianthus anomalus]
MFPVNLTCNLNFVYVYIEWELVSPEMVAGNSEPAGVGLNGFFPQFCNQRPELIDKRPLQFIQIVCIMLH